MSMRDDLIAAFGEWCDTASIGMSDDDYRNIPEELADVAESVIRGDRCSFAEDIPNEVACPKCGDHSGDDWSQCKGTCPMPMSPHYSTSPPRGWRFRGAAPRWNRMVRAAEQSLKEGGVFS